MPIISKTEMDARRARAAAARAADAAKDLANPSSNDKGPSDPRSSEAPANPKQRRGHAVKDESGKWQPTGDYVEGFARAPVKSRFQPGNKGGPGRPPGSQSHDKLLKKHLDKKLPATLEGRRRAISKRELIVMSVIKDAIEGKHAARNFVLGQIERLYPDHDGGGPISIEDINESDALSIAEFTQDLRRQLAEEMTGLQDEEDAR